MNHSWLISYQQSLSLQIKQKQLPHAFLFSGLKGVGKQLLANWLSEVLACKKPNIAQNNILQPCAECKHCQLMQSHTFPDHFSLQAEKNTLGVDAIRKVGQFIQKKAQLNGSKTVVIEDAELMTESAANALLKTLEEPTERSFIVLLASDVQRLLPTVISRCRVIHIRPYVGKQLQAFLQSNHNDRFANLSHVPELTDSQLNDEYIVFCQQLNCVLLQKNSLQSIAQQLTDNENGLRWLEKSLVNAQRKIVNWQHNESNSIGSNIESHVNNSVDISVVGMENIQHCYKILQNSQKLLVNLPQANKLFVIEKMLIDMQNYCAKNYN